MEGVAMVCYSTGTINSLLDKLTKLKNHSNPADEFSLLTENLKEDLLGLKEDFSNKVAVPKLCLKHARELVFEIEDWIDQKPETNMLDPSEKEKVEYFKAKIHRARERFTWYYNLLKVETTEFDSPSSKITNNPPLPMEEKPCHGLLDGPRDELIKYLTDDKEEMLKVVSVVGVEGIGKTTLAKEIYSELQLRGLFECQAIVSVARGRPIREILNDILRQVNPKKFSLFSDLQRIISDLREYLGTKRYFILFDGIWSTWAWKVINCALPNNHGSRVLITTCTMGVGKSCSSYPNDLVYQMEALSEENSRTLFFSRIINLQQEEKGAGFEEASGYMLKMCGGMPLAIIVAAGLLLASKFEALGESKMLGESIYSLMKQYSTSDGMTKVLQMSYADLSLPMKSCFLYLSVFPENYTIKKDRLIRLWRAEGFIPRIDEEYLWVTGEMFFNELISRRLIQPVFNFDDDQAVGCTVHTLILDFIRSLSREESFSMTATELNSGPFPCDTIRRFSLDDCHNEEEAHVFTRIVHLSSIRSLTVSGDVAGILNPPPPSFSEDDDEKHASPAIRVSTLLHFKLMRVLDLEGTSNLRAQYIECIGGLVLLRYLGLAGTGITWLPEDIGKLEQLETLDLRRNQQFSYLPASIVKLQKLTHLLLEVDATKIWEMPELEAASDLVVGSISSLCKVVELLRKSEQLRMLGVIFRIALIPTETDLVSFLDEVVKSKLQSLCLHFHSFGKKEIALLVDSWEKVTASLVKNFEPQRFELRIKERNLKRVPLPTNMGSLASLTHLHIDFDKIEAQDFLVLGGLTNLVRLNLFAYDCPVRGKFIITEGIFRCLKVFFFVIEKRWTGPEFEEGAMPQLQRLGRSLRLSERCDKEYPDIGIDHLTCLTRLHLNIDCSQVTVSEVEAAEAAIRAQVSQIPTKPTLQLVRTNENRIGRKEEQGQRSSSRGLVPTIADKLTLESSIEGQDQMRKDKGKHQLQRSTVSQDKMKKDHGRQLIGSRKAYEIEKF